MHQNAAFYLKFWQDGGISGTREKNKEKENLRFNLLSLTKYAGDVFGEWTDSGLSFSLVTRQPPSHRALHTCEFEVGGGGIEGY